MLVKTTFYLQTSMDLFCSQGNQRCDYQKPLPLLNYPLSIAELNSNREGNVSFAYEKLMWVIWLPSNFLKKLSVVMVLNNNFRCKIDYCLPFGVPTQYTSKVGWCFDSYFRVWNWSLKIFNSTWFPRKANTFGGGSKK